MNPWMTLFVESGNTISALGPITSAFAAIATLGVAALTTCISKGLLNENKILRKAGTQSEVVGFIRSSDSSINIIDFVVANVGSGSAFEIAVSTNIDPQNLKVKRVFLDLDSERYR